ncbi:UDP-N-acetylglucosamine 2-epimerase (hydrolyzing) [Helicobacter anseris]|uniref:UDP-N-acetylglucosamine 2-epimerase (Hydrolyzing) n=1 Tax=Helicobacter anseris TaxID=375926 RepID=A0A3D8JA39_9HELI|nr:UDP-N-acetylglucosamine 2-epimerase [Helicobacter anseris]RDU74357.1 UDP-N-acetylglucosamine 2-epimerase (hydrolyzing) [Helicobacter anseris]
MKKIVFLSGTRADWGKIKALVQEVKESKSFEYKIFVCGMHLLELYGKTFIEIFKDGFDEVFLAKAHKYQERMDLALSDSIKQFSNFVKEYKPDLIVIHGDRLEALAGAIVGAFNNILVAHIEGGEVSGTIDESIRHSISKLAHLHFVANEEAKRRLIQLGEKQEDIFVIGSPDIDLMLGSSLPTLEAVEKHYYQIQPFKGKYAIFLYHPVTTEEESLERNITQSIEALEKCGENFIVIYPNNDLGSKTILKAYKRLEKNPHFALFKSLKFEAFLTLLKNAKFIIGNSSAGIREAPIYGIPCINLGSRQEGRYKEGEGIVSVKESEKEILEAIRKVQTLKLTPRLEFGKGKSAKEFIAVLENGEIWDKKLQKKFVDML